MRPRLFASPIAQFCLTVILAAVPLAAPRAEDAGLIGPGAEPRVISQGHVFAEGPAADSTGLVYFSDVAKSLIWAWDPATDKVHSHQGDTGGANGLYVDGDGFIVMCQGTLRQVAFTDGDHNITVLADKYEGKKLNSPNDCWVDPKNGVYFSDPLFASRKTMEQDGEHVYYITPKQNKLIRVTTDLKRPNGLVGTADGKTLYVADMGDNKTWKYAINADGTLSGKTLFCAQGADGVTLDERGNLYLTADGVDVFSPAGKRVATIKLPLRPTNLTFGGKDFKTLVATCRTKVFALQMNVKGAGR